MNALVLVSALLLGLLGSAHCAVMCGGVVAMTCAGLSPATRSRLGAQLPYLLAYNAGRVGSYSVCGAIGGLVGSSVASFGPVQRGQLALRLAAGLLTLAVGLYVAGFAPALRWIERAGEPLWRRIAPVAARLVPVQSPWQALTLGMLWGFMPCGLVYAAMAVAVSSGSPARGAAVMAAFGLGTLPMLVAMGSAAAFLAHLARRRSVRTAAGVAMLLLGAAQVEQAASWAHLAQTSAMPCCHRAGWTVPVAKTR